LINHGFLDLCPGPLPIPVDAPLQLNFSQTLPAVTISQITNHTYGEVTYMFLTLEELSPNSTVVQRLSLQNANWSLGSYANFHGGRINGRIATYNYTSTLSNGALFEYYFVSTLSANSTVVLANNYTFEFDPRYLKLSVFLSFWNWTSINDRLRFTIGVAPSFNVSEQRINTPVANVTTLFLHSFHPNQSSAFVELLNFGLVGTHATPVLCSVEAHANTSSFAMIFAYFGNASLYYDPAFSLILGQSGSSSSTTGSGDGDGFSTAVIIAISVVIPIAVLTVVAVIFLALGLVFVTYLRSHFAKGGMVQFAHATDDNETL